MSISSKSNSIIDFLVRSRLTRSAQVLYFIAVPILFGSLTPQLALRVIVLFLISYHINFYNDYCDRFEDSIDAKKRARNLFCSPEDSKQFAIAIVFLNALWIIGLGLTLLFDQSFFLYACAGYLFGVVYSHPKIRVRNRTYWDMIWHGMWPVVGGTPVILSATTIPLSIRLASVGLTFLASVLAQMHQQLHDYETDRQNKSQNTIQQFERQLGVVLFNATFIFLIVAILVGFAWQSLYYGIWMVLGLLILFHIKERQLFVLWSKHTYFYYATVAIFVVDYLYI